MGRRVTMVTARYPLGVVLDFGPKPAPLFLEYLCLWWTLGPVLEGSDYRTWQPFEFAEAITVHLPI